MPTKFSGSSLHLGVIGHRKAPICMSRPCNEQDYVDLLNRISCSGNLPKDLWYHGLCHLHAMSSCGRTASVSRQSLTCSRKDPRASIPGDASFWKNLQVDHHGKSVPEYSRQPSFSSLSVDARAHEATVQHHARLNTTSKLCTGISMAFSPKYRSALAP